MSIWSALLEALRNEEHSELIGDEVAIFRPQPIARDTCYKTKKLNKLIGLLEESTKRCLDKSELENAIQLLREQTLTFQKQEHTAILKEVREQRTL